MKHYIHKTLSILMVCLATLSIACLTACDDDDHPNFGEIVNPNPSGNNIVRYRGNYQTHHYAGPTDYGRDTICVVDYIKASDSTKGDSIIMYNVRFSELMPVTLEAICITDIAYLNNQLSLRHDSIIPLWKVAGMWKPYEMLPITNLNGYLKGDSLVFNMQCGDFPLKFAGIKAIHTKE